MKNWYKILLSFLGISLLLIGCSIDPENSSIVNDAQITIQSKAISFPLPKEPVLKSPYELKIGDYYAGGIVAYILKSCDRGYDPNRVQGLIVAETDLSVGLPWNNGRDFFTEANGSYIGDGGPNTGLIVSWQGTGSYAARLCYDLVLNGYNDWFLPSSGELAAIYENKDIIKGFANEFYWTSSEAIGTPSEAGQNKKYYAKAINFGRSNIAIEEKFKTYNYRVRAIRSFGNFVGWKPAIVRTTAVNSVTSNSAWCGGQVSNEGLSQVTARGVCWGTSPNPLVTGNHTSDGTGLGYFPSVLTGLSPATTYYVRAYATNRWGTAYGETFSFTTNSPTGITSLTLYPTQDGRVFSISPNHAADYASYFAADAWTWNGTPGTVRSLVQYDLSKIPVNSTILEARLVLSHHPDIPHSATGQSNAAYLERITQPWSATTACWNNQPSVSSTNRVYIPASTSTTQNYNITVTQLVNDLRRYGNYGIRLRLVSESRYARMYFASSEYPQTNMWPTLVIRYK